MIYIAAAGILVSLGIFIHKMIKGKGKRVKIAVGFGSAAVAAASYIFAAFILLYGCSYAAESKTEGMELEVKERSTEELFLLCTKLADEADRLSVDLEYEKGIVTYAEFEEYADEVTEAVSKYTGVNAARPKYVLSSRLMSYTKITGVFFPFTGEANVNYNTTAPSLPLTMAHELMHCRGVTAEDEANFFAFVSLYEEGSDFCKYSAVYMGLLYSLPKLKNADKNLYAEVVAKLSDGVKEDINAYSAHWAKYSGVVARASTKINNSYLIAQGEDDGVSSYGRVIDLMLAYFAEK